MEGHRAAVLQGRSGAGVMEQAVLARSVLKVVTNLITWPPVQDALKVLHLQRAQTTVLAQQANTGVKHHVIVALRVQQIKRVLTSVSPVLQAPDH